MLKMLIYLIISIIDLFVWLGIIIYTFDQLYQTFLFMTTISYTLSTFYLLTMSFYELYLYLHKNNEVRHKKIKESKIYSFLRDRLFVFIFTAEVTVCTTYWVLRMGGRSIIDIETSPPLPINLHIHFFIGFQILLEHLLTDRKHYKQDFIKESMLFYAFSLIYSIFLTVVVRTYDLNIYPFLKLEYSQILAINIVELMAQFNVYQLYHYIMDSKNSKKNNSIYEENNKLIVTELA